MDILLQYFAGFMLIFCRIASFFVVAPVFSSRNVPGHFKIGLAFFVSVITFSALGVQTVPMDGLYLISVLKEVLIGLLLGFTAYLFFTAFQIAGSFVDMQIGFSLANIIDPMTGAASPILGNLKYMIAILLFLSLNGHHMLLQAIMQSYDWVPLQNEMFARIYNGQVSEFLIHAFTETFALAFKMAAPLVAALFLTDVGLGILARTAPQFNIFVVGVPLKILVGLVLLGLLFPGMMVLFQIAFESLFAALDKAISLLAGPPN